MRTKLDFIIRGGVVKRFHTIHTLHTQNVAEHSFGVAWLCYLLCNGVPTRDLLVAALSHDIAEHTTGDIPAPAKRRLGISQRFDKYEMESYYGAGFEMQRLDAGESRTLKMADTADLLLFCIRELRLGNSDMEEVYQRGLSYITELEPLSSTEKELIHYIGEEHDKCK